MCYPLTNFLFKRNRWFARSSDNRAQTVHDRSIRIPVAFYGFKSTMRLPVNVCRQNWRGELFREYISQAANSIVPGTGDSLVDATASAKTNAPSLLDGFNERRAEYREERWKQRSLPLRFSNRIEICGLVSRRYQKIAITWDLIFPVSSSPCGYLPRHAISRLLLRSRLSTPFRS